MKKSELKALLKVITEEAVAVKQEQLNETKGLSGMKKAPESTEHTEKVADSKDLTGPAPKEKEEGKKLPVVKKPANPQKVGSLNEMTPAEMAPYINKAGPAMFIVAIVLSIAIVVAVIVFIFAKANDGKPLPAIKDLLKRGLRTLRDLEVTDDTESVKKKVEQNQAGLPLPFEDLQKIAETVYRNGASNKDIATISNEIKDQIEQRLRDMGKGEYADLIKNTSVGTGETRRIVSAVVNLLMQLNSARVSQTSSAPTSAPTSAPANSPKPDSQPRKFLKPKSSTDDLKKEVMQMIREEIDEMARKAGAVDPQYRKEIEPGKWIIMGHPNQKKYPDGTPTFEPKGPYVKKGKNMDAGGIPTRTPPASSSRSTRSRETELAVADILKHDPEATDQEIAEELASRSDSGEPLNLAPAVVANAISIAKDGERETDDTNEPVANDLASKEKVEKQRKMANLRAYLMRKRGIKPTK